MFFDTLVDQLNDHTTMAIGLHDIEQSSLNNSTAEEMETNNNQMEESENAPRSSITIMKIQSSQKSGSSAITKAAPATGGGNTSCFYQLDSFHHELPPPVPMDYNQYLKHVASSSSSRNRQPNTLTILDLTSQMRALELQQRVATDQHEDLEEVLARYQELRSEQEEEEQLKERMKQLESDLEQAKLDQAKSKKKIARELKDAKADEAEAKKKLDKSLKTTNDLQDMVNKNKKILDDATTKLERFIEEVKVQDAWFDYSGLSVLRGSDEVTTMNESTSTAGSSDSDVIMLQLTNINPANPKQLFIITMKMLDVSDGKFRAKDIYPPFEGSKDIIKAAQEFKDFVKLLLDCKKHWLQDLALQSSSENEEAPDNNMDATRALFESPKSEGCIEDSDS